MDDTSQTPCWLHPHCLPQNWSCCPINQCPLLRVSSLNKSWSGCSWPVSSGFMSYRSAPWNMKTFVFPVGHSGWRLSFPGRLPPSHMFTVHFYFFYMGLRHAAYYYFHSCKLSFSLLPSSLAAGATLSDSCVSPLIADVILMMNLRCNSWLICTDVSAIRVLDSLMVWFNHGALGENMLSWVTRSDQELTWFALHSLPAPFCFCFLMYDCMTSKTETTEHVWKQARGEVRVTLWNWHVTCCVSGWYLA